MNSNRSEAARKANATRKANKEAERQRQTKQIERREAIWNALPKAEQDNIGGDLLQTLVTAESEYEKMLSDWHGKKTEEVKDTFRNLLRRGVNAKTILAGVEQGYIERFQLGVYGMTIAPEQILSDVLIEDEFLGHKQPTDEACLAMWELTETHCSA